MRSIFEIGSNVPAFLGKLWKLVDDPGTDHLISWSPEGKMFNIQNQADFARELLPLYYKHNNMASFIRQLNMYGFHKVTSVENGGLKSEKDEIEFCHPYFIQGKPYLLEHIKRKIANPRLANGNISEDKTMLRPELMTKVLVDVKQMKGKQESLDARFSVMKHENEALWREVALLRQKHIKQQQIVNNLIQFLMSLVQTSRSGPLKTGVKRRYQLMINNAAHNSSNSDKESTSKSPRLETDTDFDLEDNEIFEEMDDNGPIIHEVEQELSEGASGRNILLFADPDARASVSPNTTASYPDASPPFSGPPFIAPEDIDDSEIQIEVSADLENILAANVQSSKCSSATENPSDNANSDSILINNKASSSKRQKKASAKEDLVGNTPSVSVPDRSIISSQPSPTLPKNIFDNDETNSQDETGVSLSDVDQQAALSASQNDVEQYIIDPTTMVDSTDFLNSVAMGNYNPNINLNSAATTPKGKKNKTNNSNNEVLLRNIKEEILNPEEEDWNNMILATVPSESTKPPLNRFQEEVDDHLDAMQSDLENIKQLLRGENYTFDANTLLGLFGQDEALYNLPPMNPAEMTVEKTRDNVEDPASQVISYVPPPNTLFDFCDIQLDDSDNGVSEDIVSPINDSLSTLNTPQVQMSEPDFSSK